MRRQTLIVAQMALQLAGETLLDAAARIARGGGHLLQAARWCGARAREWQPRLWQRGRDPRSETEERRS